MAAADWPKDDLTEGQLLADRYRITDFLGHGGMGLVYGALDLQTGSRVAVKLPRKEVRNRKKALARFERESRAASRLRGPNVVRVTDVAELDDGTPFIVMELLTGRDLASELDARGALPVAEAVGYVLQAASGVAEAHAAGIVHRDLKPHNLFLVEPPVGTIVPGARRTIKVFDFGISKIAGAEVVRVTTTNARLGTPLYVSPEQLVSAKYVDARSDVWSLGVILYELLTGRLPFEGSTAILVAAAIQAAEPAPPSAHRAGIPPELERVLAKALAKRADERYSDVSELARALAPYAEAGAFVAPSPAPARAPIAPLAAGGTHADEPREAATPRESGAREPTPRESEPRASRLPGAAALDRTAPEPSRLLLVLAALFGVALLAFLLVYR